MSSPLEQFELVSFSATRVFCLYDRIYSISSSFLILIFIFFFLFFLLNFKFSNLPSRYQYIIEQPTLFIKNLIEASSGKYALKFLLYLLPLFLFILFCNLLGMVPYSFTLTSHLVITFGLSFFSFFGLNYIGFSKNGLFFFSVLLPPGAPLFLAPLLIFIELLSYIARLFSLAIRLFANLMSGHTLLKILSEFAWNMLCSLSLVSLLFIFPFIIIFLVTGLEIAIAFLQAYVFTILVSIYLNDSLNLH